MLWWTGFPGNQGNNYIEATAKQIKAMGDYKWLCSLPMYEYAFVLVSSTAIKFGDDPVSYYNNLYVKRMIPILEAYYKRLMRYRIDRSILEFSHACEQKWVTNKSVTAESGVMKIYAEQTRRALRAAVQDYMDHVNDPSLPEKSVEDTLPDAFPVSPSEVSTIP